MAASTCTPALKRPAWATQLGLCLPRTKTMDNKANSTPGLWFSLVLFNLGPTSEITAQA